VDPLPPLPPLPPPPPPAAPRKSGLAFFGLLLALFLPGMLAQALHLALGLLWTQLFAFLLPALVLAAGSNLRPTGFLRLRPVGPSLLALGALTGLAGYAAAVGVMGLARELMPAAWLDTFDVGRVFEGAPLTRVGVALVAALVAPVCEEIAFRGYLQSALGTRLRPALAVAGSTVLFSVIHLDPVRLPSLLVLGGVFGWLTWRAGSVLPAIAAHAANNAIVSGLVLAGVSAPDASAELPALGVRLRGAAFALAVGLALLWPLLRAFADAARAQPPGPDPLAPRDPAVASYRFRARRVPFALRAAAFAGAWLLLALALAGVLGWLPGRPRP
jgi:membrane protease YdiL (CAAX protease family)